MVYTVFWVAVTLAPALLFFFGFKMLPKENWQIIGSIPVKKEENGSWTGLNLTYYGLFNAIACGYSVLLLIVLLGSISISSWMILFIVISILLICIPASRILARWVEKKTNTLTLGGASFAGFLFLPWGLWLTRMVPDPFAGFQVPVLPGLAAVSIAYVFGESLGRLACVSFGCCYGKALREVHPALRRLFTNHCFIFSGKTKKIAYAHGLDGQKVLPIQAITSGIYLMIGVSGLYLYLRGLYTTAFLGTLIPSQAWRFLSEFFRADYRGTGKISAYQHMSLAIIVYALAVSLVFFNSGATSPVLLKGIMVIWNPVIILFIQGVFFATFFLTGRSHVTLARMSFYVSQEKI